MSRKLLNAFHDLHPHKTGEPACRAFAWIDLIGLARWAPGRGLERGQLEASVRFLSARWNWGRDKVMRFLAQLESDSRITRDKRGGHRCDRITICNYDTYQTSRATDATANATSDTTKEEEGNNKGKESPSARARARRAPIGLVELRALLGPHAAAADLAAETVGGSVTWPRAIVGLYGPNGTRREKFRAFRSEDEIASVLAESLVAFAGESREWHQRFFDSIVDRRIALRVEEAEDARFEGLGEGDRRILRTYERLNRQEWTS